MGDSGFKHSEAFLQWIWENLLFDFTALQTNEGQPVHVLDPGKQNVTDGPDFKQAIVQIGNLTWHGDVELHINNRGWLEHRHHEDPNYNNVILHVVAEKGGLPAITKSGQQLPTLNLEPHLSKELSRFLKSFSTSGKLNCSTGLQFISERAFYEQLDKAHLEYFEKKADDFLQYYDPELLPTQAWKYALVISLWDGLGISHNRKPMQKTACKWIQVINSENRLPAITEILEFAGFKNKINPDLKWNYKSVRPANHPRNRIIEAINLSEAIINLPFDHFLNLELAPAWDRFLYSAGLKKTGRYQILYGTVFLPALYMLGKLFAHQKLSDAAFSSWKHLKTPIPSSILSSFHSLPINNQRYRKKLGSVHLLNAYCKAGKCTECFVLKKAIQS
ncbi:DUF2851 family protein [Gracilimonas tropica]|uniref:DUF2851 family protein n=1 Tax=Gracilimonas tropica TaxID=454600 RepID=UPI0003822A62|nr:DUF2851 family protein [Gracilimonas tropica]